MNVEQQILEENKVHINYNYSELTDYYRSRNYNVAILRIPDRYDILIKIYDNLKMLNDIILNMIPERKAYLNIDERHLNFKIYNSNAWQSSKYLEAFIYSLAICKNNVISDYSGLITKYYNYVNYFLSNDCINMKNKKRSICKKLKVFDIGVKYYSINNITHPYLLHIDYIQHTSKYEDGYNPLKSNFELSEHKLILLETLVYSKYEPTRMKLYEKFNILDNNIQQLNKYVEDFNYKNKEKFETDDENLKNGFICSCCITNYADCLYIGCNHLALCSECYNSENIKYEQKKKCPMCKTYSHVVQIKSG